MMSPIQIIFFTQNCVLSKKSDDIILSWQKAQVLINISLILKNKIIFIIIELIIGDLFMKIEKDAENILNKFSKTLEDIPDLEETWYITDNLNLTREDKSHEKHPEKILRNAHIDKEGKLVVKRADWVN